MEIQRGCRTITTIRGIIFRFIGIILTSFKNLFKNPAIANGRSGRTPIGEGSHCDRLPHLHRQNLQSSPLLLLLTTLGLYWLVNVY